MSPGPERGGGGPEGPRSRWMRDLEALARDAAPLKAATEQAIAIAPAIVEGLAHPTEAEGKNVSVEEAGLFSMELRGLRRAADLLWGRYVRLEDEATQAGNELATQAIATRAQTYLAEVYRPLEALADGFAEKLEMATGSGVLDQRELPPANMEPGEWAGAHLFHPLERVRDAIPLLQRSVEVLLANPDVIDARGAQAIRGRVAWLSSEVLRIEGAARRFLALISHESEASVQGTIRDVVQLSLQEDLRAACRELNAVIDQAAAGGVPVGERLDEKEIDL